MKICTKCKLNKELLCFNKNKYICKKCVSNYNKQYKQSNSITTKQYNKIYKYKHKQEIKEYQAKYNKQYYIKNKKVILEKGKIYNLENRTKINESRSKRLKVDPIFQISTSLRNRFNDLINSGLIDFKHSKSKRSFELLGCSLNFFKTYI
jgi:hypothetical protein